MRAQKRRSPGPPAALAPHAVVSEALHLRLRPPLLCSHSQPRQSKTAAAAAYCPAQWRRCLVPPLYPWPLIGRNLRRRAGPAGKAAATAPPLRMHCFRFHRGMCPTPIEAAAVAAVEHAPPALPTVVRAVALAAVVVVAAAASAVAAVFEHDRRAKATAGARGWRLPGRRWLSRRLRGELQEWLTPRMIGRTTPPTAIGGPARVEMQPLPPPPPQAMPPRWEEVHPRPLPSRPPAPICSPLLVMVPLPLPSFARRRGRKARGALKWGVRCDDPPRSLRRQA